MPRSVILALVGLSLMGLARCAPSQPKSPAQDLRTQRVARAPNGARHALVGKASWYGERFHGRRTACGEPFDMRGFTAAHKTLPFHTIVRVWDPSTRQSVVVRVNDRGPYSKGRVIDLSRAAAQDLGILRRGVAPVRLDVLQWGDGSRCDKAR